MNGSHGLERRLADHLRAEAQHQVPDRVLASTLAAIDSTPQRHGLWPVRRSARMTKVIKFTVGAVTVAAAAVVGLSLLDGGRVPLVGPAASPSPGPSASPSPSPASPTAPPLTWSGPLRPDSAALPVIPQSGYGDATDAAVPWIDIVAVHAGESLTGNPRSWKLDLAAAPPPASALDPTQRVIAYGLVLDAGGDGTADCVVGISNEAPGGKLRAWVTDLATHSTEAQVGPPYGYPFDFRHPDERDRPDDPAAMTFWFRGALGRCATVGEPLHYYAWASVTDAGRVTGWDYAPDDAWLSQPWPVTKP
jgi:hypothetical protein